MPNLLKLGILLLVLFFAFTEGWPWVREHLPPFRSATSAGGSGAGGDDGPACVETARAASDAFAQQAQRYATPPIDAAAWSQAALDLRSRIGDARSACLCPGESCRTASRALDRLDSMVGSIDGAANGGSPPLNLAAHQNEVDDLLQLARAQARRGD